MWDYIKKNELPAKTQKTVINPDTKLKLVIGVSPISMFAMTKGINKHLK